MAVVGPLTSIVLGVALTWLGAGRLSLSSQTPFDAAAILGGLSPLATMLVWRGRLT